MDQVMQAGAQAGNSLGGLIARALTGNAALKQKVYNATLDQVAGQYQKAQAGRKYASEADLNNDRLSALGGLQDAYAQNDLSPGQAILASLAARSADSLKDGDVINAALKLGAVNRSDAGNTQGSNAMLAAVQGKPMDYTKIDQNTAYNPNMTPDQSGMAPTQVGMGDIAAKMAQAAASRAAASNSYASAGEHQAHSRLFDTQTAAGGFSPGSSSGAGGGAESLLTDDAKALMAAGLSHGYSIPLPSFGIGAAGAQAKAQALNQLAASVKNNGVAWDDAISNMLQGKTATAGLTDVQKSSAKVNAWENSAAKQADIVLGLSDKTDRTGVPLFNKWLLAGRQGTGDVDVARFNNGVSTLAEEYARVMGGGNSTATDSTRQLAHTMLNSAMTQDQFNGVVGLMKQEMATRKAALSESVDQTRNTVIGKKSHEGDQPAMPKSDDEYNALPSGAMFVDPEDGKTYRKP